MVWQKLQLTIVNPIGFSTLNSAWGFLRWASDSQQRSGAALKKRQQQQQQPNNKPADALSFMNIYVYIYMCVSDIFLMILFDPQ